MPLAAAGHPLHTRALSVTLGAAPDGEAAFAAYVLDLRKRGFAPVAGDLQGPGIIHHMRLDGRIDRSAGRLAAIAAAMPAVAFEATPATGGESCRDQIGRVASLAGLTLDDAYARQVGGAIGGPRGCSHVLTLAQLLAPAARWGLAEDARLHGEAPRRAGERLFRRDVTVDGYEGGDGTMLLTLQLDDLHFAPAPALAQPIARLGAQREITGRAVVGLGDLTLRALTLHERLRDRASLRSAAWVERSADAATLVGASLRAGISARVLAALPAGPLRDAVLQLAPAMIQCFAALDVWQLFDDGGIAAETGGLPDACWMWRRDGALARARATPDPQRS